MRIAFMGSPTFAAVTLEVLLKGGREVAVVITQPDRERGRGRAIRYTPVKEIALRHRIQVLQPVTPNSKEFVEELDEAAPDVIVLVSYGHILKRSVLSVPRKGCINLHPSLLPKYRGAAPIHWAIINGDEETGVTTMLMNERMDAGQILEQRTVRIRAEETTGELSKRLAEVGAELLLSTLKLVERDEVVPKNQNSEEATFAPKITAEMRLIDWTDHAVRIGRLVRGLSPFPGSYTSFRGKRVGLLRAVDLPGGVGESPGRVVADVNRLLVETGKGILRIKEIQPEGKKPMNGKAFLNGYKPTAGELMG